MRDTYRVGDTIDVAFRLPGVVRSEGTSTFVNLKRVDIRSRSSASRIDQILNIEDRITDVFHNFDLLTFPGAIGNVELERISELSSGVFAEPEQDANGDFVYSFSLVPKSVGLYFYSFASIIFGQQLGLSENIVEIEDECETTKVLYRILNGATDENLDLLCESSMESLCVTDEPRRSKLYENYRRQAFHVFRVVE
ncbi:hypothetical protein QWY85_07585 [Neolewinella lacunae]|uniref:Uncharacterized protein n=1 Tax=Neolewinella lacunae TaxID=1517758 RepID=A0A923PLI3_9BACT|nr:hypothetical protein [Neolewinella lacunae]MBC6994640.1 hypothetical protein [Neolewinella lacunae]MDN3634512.1 hypothetical protein [Neolewinella lacunae]